ncbi:Propionyl-CoA carboxylase [Acidimicrobium ferrooxidans DSM 10331]|uniref:Propionyl-CoA carboxylase n=1 Tax=Acidimicrobium ferrooxidans (strain DSM 10331 / JCM 15462 / NBRC 103882 / ICP) TaxID=525909 RepID=C7LZW4_ACIFD|nr:acyl-CoA carboxylase subunit beta [Acidimicrobium ferrooxidans]ACU54272.1 Propionyl-CoA carboxylase [Acidimicrobium ferrooxidans DSM 10331]
MDQYERIGELAETTKYAWPSSVEERLVASGKLHARERIGLLVDAGSFREDGLFANATDPSLPADGVVTGTGTVDGRPVAIMANDQTVKAGSWGARTVEKIVRITELAYRHRLPIIYLVDSAGARITDQVELFPGRRGAGRIFANQVRLSGRVPQVCCLFGPSAAGGAYIPAFCDVVFMVEGHASMYLGSPRMAEVVIGERVTLEEMGGARMHATISGCGDNLVVDDRGAIEAARAFLSYLPSDFEGDPPREEPREPLVPLVRSLIPDAPQQGYDIHRVIEGLVDAGSFFELKPLFAPELVIGFARLDGQSIGIVANNPAVKGGVLFVDSADKAARFIWLCDAFNIPLVFLADVPGFMIGSEVERQGIIRHGAKMITAVAEATVPKVSVIVRKAYGAGLYAMCGPAFDPEATIALPGASIAVMGPEPAVNAVYYRKIQEIDDPAERERFVAARREEYERDVDLVRLAADLVVDAIVQPEDLRSELIARLSRAAVKDRHFSERRHGVPPV